MGPSTPEEREVGRDEHALRLEPPWLPLRSVLKEVRAASLPLRVNVRRGSGSAKGEGAQTVFGL